MSATSRKPAFALAATLAAAALGSAAAADILNPSFEEPGLGFRSVAAGQTYGSWTCAGPNDIEFVHAVPNPGLPGLQFSAYDGQYWIDLCGVGAPSAIYQDIDTLAPGATYRVDFAFAANLWGPNFNFIMDVVWNGATVGTFSRIAGGGDGSQMNWERNFVDVLATGNDRLMFRAVTGTSARGPAIDDLHIAPVPAPGAAAAFLALAPLALRRRRTH